MDTKDVTSWFLLGIHLGIEVSVLTSIEGKYKSDNERFKIEVIQFWLRNDQEPSWSTLAKAVEDMGGHAKVVQTLKNHQG